MFAGDVLQRIESFVLETIQVIAAGQLPVFPFPSRQASESLVPFALRPTPSRTDIPAFAEGGDDNFHNEWEELLAAPAASTDMPSWERLYKKESNGKTILKDLISRNGVYGFSIARVFKIMDCVHELLLESKKCTQRELYYRVLAPPIFSSLNDVTEAVSDVCCLLQVPRSSLNICCTSKGAVAGLVEIKDIHSDCWKDCTRVGSMGYSIPGDAIEIQQMQITSNARFVIIIEKDAIFQRLTEDRFFEYVPSVLVTARGMPDLCTRIFLDELISKAPQLIILGLVDWNPSGVAILTTYKHGSSRMGPHANQYVLPSLKWLGIRTQMLDGVPKTAFQSLTQRDRSMIQTLRPMLKHSPLWLQELQCMEESGMKCDIEALYSITNSTGLTHRLVQCIATGQYLN